MNTATLRQQLANIGQEQVLRFFDQLDRDGKEILTGQIAALDLSAIHELIETQVKVKKPLPLPTDIRPAEAFPRLPDPDRRTLYADAEARAAVLLREGKIGAFLVAGGQGTRLGYDGPKGEYPVTPVKNKPLFQVFAEQLLAHSRDCGKPIPWYIMTSDVNDAPTRAFFHQHHYFGYAERDVFFFQQGMMPAFSMRGEMLLGSEDSLALSPDGTPRFNAGSIAIHALRVSFIERLNASGRLDLPWHRAEKKVPYVDEHGETIKPEKPNAVKLEQFVFDAIPLAKNAMVYTTDRAEEFSPVKNAQGVDSPDTCRRDQVRRAARWLGGAGVRVSTRNGEPDALLEISPLLATSAKQLASRRLARREITPGESVFFDEASAR
jgi:UDP-N-acetylglucosamine pyrophosphorylase